MAANRTSEVLDRWTEDQRLEDDGLYRLSVLTY